MKKTPQKTYFKLIKKTLVEISLTPKDNPARFEILKRKLKKYYELAKWNAPDAE